MTQEEINLMSQYSDIDDFDSFFDEMKKKFGIEESNLSSLFSLVNLYKILFIIIFFHIYIYYFFFN
jgi:hypothetical protein